MRTLFLVLGIFLLWTANVVVGQNRVSEDEINIQKLFIDAHKERLLGNYDKAISKLEELTKLQKDEPSVYFEMARIFELKNDTKKAITQALKAVELDSKNTWYNRLLGQLYQNEGQFDRAALIYEQLTKLESENQEFYQHWAFLLVKANDLEKAIQVYDQMESKFGFNKEIAQRRHTLYLGQGKTKKAARELELLVESDPNNIEYRLLLASFYEQSTDHSAAENQYKRILELDPGNAKALVALAGKKGAQNNEKEFFAALSPLFSNKSISIDQKIGKILPNIQTAANTQNKDLATELLSLTAILEEVHPSEAKAFAASGDLNMVLNNLDVAKEKFEKAISLDESVFSVWEQLFFINSTQKKYNELLRLTDSALDLFPNKPSVYYYGALANYQSGNFDEAIGLSNEALFISSNNPSLKSEFYILLGRAYMSNNRIKEALDALEKGLELQPGSSEGNNQLSRCLAITGNSAKAIQIAESLCNSSPNHYPYYSSLAFAYSKNKEFSKAQTTFEKAISLGGNNDPFTLENFGDVLFHQNKLEEAVNYWKKALEMGSISSNLKKKIADKKLYE